MNTIRVLAVACVALLLAGLPATGQEAPKDPDCLRVIAAGAGTVDLQTVTIPELQRELDAGRLTSRQLVEAYFARIDAFDVGGPKLNSVRQLHDEALAQADALDAERTESGKRGLMHGIPVLLKDNVGTTDLPTTAGSIALEGSVPLHDAHLTQLLRDDGAIILGKLNLSEFAGWMDLRMPPGYSSLAGQVINPYDFARTPSGSSAGSGVAATMAFGTVTIGTETSGSILSPSNANSAVGIKPTVGLSSRYGILPLAPTFDTPGPMTRNVTDAAILLGAIAGADERDEWTAASEGQLPPGNDYTPFLREDGLEGVRLGVSDDDRDSLDDDERAVFERAIADMERLGATIVPIESLSNSSLVGLAEIAAVPNEFKYSINKYLAEETRDDLRVRTLSDVIAFNEQHPDRVKYGQTLLEASDATPGSYDDPVAIAQRESAIASARLAIDTAMAENDADAILAPTNYYANVGAAAQYPTVIVPAGYTEGGTRPFGVSFLGQAFEEPQLISYAFAYEQGSMRRVPPTVVNPDLFPKGCRAPSGQESPSPSPGATEVVPTDGGTEEGDPVGVGSPSPSPGQGEGGAGGLPATGGGFAAVAVGALLLGALAQHRSRPEHHQHRR